MFAALSIVSVAEVVADAAGLPASSSVFPWLRDAAGIRRPQRAHAAVHPRSSASIYYFVPNAQVRLRDVWFGAILAGVLWRLAFAGFSWYVRDFSRFSVHGSVAAVVVFLVWVYLSAVILLYGVEVTAAYAQTAGSSCRRKLQRHAVREACRSSGDVPIVTSCPIVSRANAVRIFCSTRTTRSTGTPWGDEAFARARARGQADLSVDRLLDVPLVPRDGARVVRGRRRSPTVLNRDFVSDQGRSRRAAGRRSRLHDVRAGDDRRRRLADERVAHAGAASRSSAARIFRRRRGGAGRASSTCWRRSRARGATSGRACSQSADDDRRAAARGDRRRRAAPIARPWPDATRSRPASPRSRRRSTRGTAASAARRSFRGPSELLFLLDAHARHRRRRARRTMALETLRAMALGGMRDHVGGGFHRYSVDAEWRVPHFEKMLYDQAQLVLAYLEAAQVSGDRVLRGGRRGHARLRRCAT